MLARAAAKATAPATAMRALATASKFGQRLAAGPTLDDFIRDGGQDPEPERVVLGNTSQCGGAGLLGGSPC